MVMGALGAVLISRFRRRILLFTSMGGVCVFLIVQTITILYIVIIINLQLVISNSNWYKSTRAGLDIRSLVFFDFSSSNSILRSVDHSVCLFKLPFQS